MIQNKSNIELSNWELVSVNPNKKDWNWKDLFCFWGNNIQTIIGFSLITSLYLLYDLNVVVIFFGSLLASILVIFFSNLIGKPSQKHGITFPVLLRISMGINGARYIAMLRGIVAIFMFGVQTFFLSKSFVYLIRIALFKYDNNFQEQEIFSYFYFGLDIIDWIALIFTIFLQIYLFKKGQDLIKIFINFSAVFVYIGLILFCGIIASTNFPTVTNLIEDIFILENIFKKSNIVPLATVCGTMFTYFSIVIVNFGDFSRFIKNESELKKGNASLIFNLILFSIFSIFIVLGADIILNQNFTDLDRILTNPTDIIGKFDNTFLTLTVLCFIVFASASTNLIANFIPSKYSLINFFPKTLNSNSSGVLIGLIALLVGAFWLSILSQVGALSIIDTIASFFGPIFGIVIADYYIIKKKEIINKDIFSPSKNGAYYFSGGWQLRAVFSLIIAFIFSAATIWNPELRFLKPFAWLIGATIGFIMYYLVSKK